MEKAMNFPGVRENLVSVFDWSQMKVNRIKGYKKVICEKIWNSISTKSRCFWLHPKNQKLSSKVRVTLILELTRTLLFAKIVILELVRAGSGKVREKVVRKVQISLQYPNKVSVQRILPSFPTSTVGFTPWLFSGFMFPQEFWKVEKEKNVWGLRRSQVTP